jgi:hypothetical protein
MVMTQTIDIVKNRTVNIVGNVRYLQKVLFFVHFILHQHILEYFTMFLQMLWTII